MKKLLILLITLLTPFEIAYGEVVRNYGHPTVYKTIYFKAGEKDANKILYEFALQEMKDNNWPVAFQSNEAYAYKVDLNDDGINEIIGVICHLPYIIGSSGYDIFVLKLHENNYRDICSCAFWPFPSVRVLKKKANGFHFLEIESTDGQIRYLKYENGKYDYYFDKL